MEYVHGGDIYTYKGMMDFSINVNPLGPSKSVVEAVRSAAANIEKYPDAKCRELCSALSEVLQLRPEYFTFGNGAAELIFSLVLARRPKKALILTPSFAEYEQALRAFGSEIVYYQLQEAHNFHLDERYLEYLNDDIDMIFLCSPDNPVGNVIGKELLLQILKKCQQHQILMVLDECFYEFLDSWEEATLQGEVKDNSMLFILRAFTKMHAMPGIRLGYGISSDLELLARVEMVRQPWSVSVLAQAAGLAAVYERTRILKTQTFIREERKWMTDEMNRIGVKFYPPAANYIFIKSNYDLYEELKERKILIRDCSNYKGLEKGYYRVAVRTRKENQQLMDELEKIYRPR